MGLLSHVFNSDGSMRRQDGPKMAQESPKREREREREAQEGHKSPLRERPITAFQERPKRAQGGCEFPPPSFPSRGIQAPRGLSDPSKQKQEGPRAPKTTTRGTKENPKRAQDGFKRPPRKRFRS